MHPPVLTELRSKLPAWSAGKRERVKAVEAVRSLLEEMRSLPCGELFARYNDDPNDDPEGKSTAPGRHFRVEGLEAQDGDVDGFVGEIILPALSEKCKTPNPVSIA